MEQPRGSADDAMDGRRWSEFLPSAGKPEGKLLEQSGARCSEGGNEGEDDEGEDDEEGEGSLHSLQSHVTFASLPSYMRSKSGLEMDPDRVSSCLQSMYLGLMLTPPCVVLLSSLLLHISLNLLGSVGLPARGLWLH